MAIFDRSTVSFATDEAVTETAFARLFDETLLWVALYNVKPSAGKQEVVASFGELGDWAKKTEGAEASEDTLQEQYRKFFIHDAYAKVIKITRELIDDEDVGFVSDTSAQMGEKAALTMERRGAAPFVDAFLGAEYVGEDTLSLCNSAHVNVDSANSQSNTGTCPLAM